MGRHNPHPAISPQTHPSIRPINIGSECRRDTLAKTVAVLLVITVTLTSVAQPSLRVSRQTAAAKKKADGLSPNAPISVVRVNAPEQYGTFISRSDDAFTFYDVDLKVPVTLAYTEIRKIKDGYGGYNTIRHRHTDRTKGLIIFAVAMAALGGLIGALAASKD